MNHRYSGAGIAARAGLAAAAGAGLAAGVEVATYPLWRQWCRQWGATVAEASQALPGDDLLVHPQTVTTRAITIHAPVRLIWPWLVQLGPGRGGAYTYDWIENLLGLDMHSADRILANRIAVGASAMARAATTYLMEPGSLIMERKMLIGIKQRAEHLASEAKISC